MKLLEDACKKMVFDRAGTWYRKRFKVTESNLGYFEGGILKSIKSANTYSTFSDSQYWDQAKFKLISKLILHTE